MPRHPSETKESVSANGAYSACCGLLSNRNLRPSHLTGDPFLIRIFQAIPRPARVAERDREEDEAMKGTGEDEGEPHSEIVDLEEL